MLQPLSTIRPDGDQVCIMKNAHHVIKTHEVRMEMRMGIGLGQQQGQECG